MAVYVTRDVYLDPQHYSSTQCSFVARTNAGLVSSRIHLQCRTPVYGRYIHIQLVGIGTVTNRTTDDRLTLPFRAHLCEIYAYN